MILGVILLGIEREGGKCPLRAKMPILYLHDCRDEYGGPKALEKKVAEGFKYGVGDKEDGEGGVELFGGVDANIGFEMGNLGVSDIGAIQESDEIEKRKLERRLCQQGYRRGDLVVYSGGLVVGGMA
jgi:hypothetical protein